VSVGISAHQTTPLYQTLNSSALVGAPVATVHAEDILHVGDEFTDVDACVDAIHRFDVAVVAWSVEPDDVPALLDRGVTGLCGNGVPGLVAAAQDRRGCRSRPELDGAAPPRRPPLSAWCSPALPVGAARIGRWLNQYLPAATSPRGPTSARGAATSSASPRRRTSRLARAAGTGTGRRSPVATRSTTPTPTARSGSGPSRPRAGRTGQAARGRAGRTGQPTAVPWPCRSSGSGDRFLG